jgi:acyl dehydratase
MGRFVDKISDQVGAEIFVSGWFEITQDDVDAFSVLTRDWDYMHNDPQWAADKGPWGGTIAHGFFLLSLLAHFHGQAGFPTLASDDEYVINYGLDRVRFIEPVRIGDRIQARMTVTDITTKKEGRQLVRTTTTYLTERRGDQPHVVAEMLNLCVSGEAYRDAR